MLYFWKLVSVFNYVIRLEEIAPKNLRTTTQFTQQKRFYRGLPIPYFVDCRCIK